MKTLVENEVTFFDISHRQLICIPIYDVVCAEIKDRHVQLITVDGLYITREKMRFWREKLCEECFIIPHNSYIVNLQYCTAAKRSELTIAFSKEGKKHLLNIPIAVKRQSDVLKKVEHCMRKRVLNNN